MVPRFSVLDELFSTLLPIVDQSAVMVSNDTLLCFSSIILRMQFGSHAEQQTARPTARGFLGVYNLGFDVEECVWCRLMCRLRNAIIRARPHCSYQCLERSAETLARMVVAAEARRWHCL
jgi:hypothetical protein